MIALLLATWLWDRVLVDCHGAPETTSYYYFQATVRQAALSTCLDDQGQPYNCPITIPAPPIRFGPVFYDPGSGVTVSTSVDPIDDPAMLPLPPVGGLTAWPWASIPDNPSPVVAVDAAGNKSGSICP